MPIAALRLEEIARALDDARRKGSPIARPITVADADLDDAYAIQRVLMRSAHEHGGGLRGFKIGTTSAAAMARVGVAEPLYGFIERADAIVDGGVIDLRALIAPRIEMEVAFVTAADLEGDDCDAEAVLAATAYVVPALEIIDSRYTPGPFDVVAAVADNMSTARHVLGTARLDPRAVALPTITATLCKNGVEIARGAGSAVLGDPARSVAWLVRALARDEVHVPAGSVVLSGGFADALPAAPDDTFVARFTPGGAVTCTFSTHGPHA